MISVSSYANDGLPRIAVYVTGQVPDNEKKVLGTRMLTALVKSGRYSGIERSESFLAEIQKEHIKQRSGAIDDDQISKLGRQFGVRYVCIADITPAYNAYQVSARIINVETAEVTFIGEAFSGLKTTKDLTEASDKVVANMFGIQLKRKPWM
ncbi:MAG: penicillin-binding protein activator LpoB, partial [Chitinispirillia bacterium]|nr:penicillin-binding protein activator LpoB [Chitinispirillia bacterium]